ncbi:hypothetical protein PV728_47880 [Streptomyces europaeiscabiei]|uniref:hypothetical protein n=1 Tax=Streptomyces europaeiscabiei TaxID=146819 RepID=UPI0029A526D0|nr:hypothetical protein [Streptomyces europaeiscabiei]MDX3637771.1 hypothetical protein [Streptomyces europaeiscabiei]MDX3655583.1 hypothetical protein [Streptomyces europaeiscabiei]
MNAETVINIALAAVAVTAAVVFFRLSRSRWPSERVSAARRRVGLTVWDFAAEEWIELAPGVQPGERQMTARDIDAADQLELLYLSNAYDPGLDRLRQAIRDEQHGTGDHTTTNPTGDQT